MATREVEGRVVWLSDRPIPFEAFLEQSGDRDLELVDGVMVERTPPQLDHERLFAWLFCTLGTYVEQKGLGVVLGSRIAVEISRFGGRLPDILFVRRERMQIVQQKAVFGAPDLVVEIVSPNDRPSDLNALETDYRSIGVAEIWLIDLPKQRIRTLRQRPGGYEEEELTAGPLRPEAIPGFALQAEWLFQDSPPPAFDILLRLLSPATEE